MIIIIMMRTYLNIYGMYKPFAQPFLQGVLKFNVYI